jgi:hypothetical protein
MKTSFAVAAAFVLASASAASADQVAYTFATQDGQPYCDGLVLDTTDTFAAGQHVGSQCANPVAGDFAGGLEVRGLGSRHLKWTVSTSDKANVPHTVEVYVVDPVTMTWKVYEEDTVDGVPFQLVDSGVLLNGGPPVHAGKLRPVSGVRK